ncbi:MAG: F0F1 ATP synthase subunit gamma [Candidatus Ozemobacteraceae bacterium]
MSKTSVVVQRQIQSAQGLKSVVRTMKTLAAVSIPPYEKALQALDDYVRTVEIGITTFFRNADPLIQGLLSRQKPGGIGVVVFGSDQGMVGAFNDELARFTFRQLRALSEEKRVWVVGERVYSRLAEDALTLYPSYSVPESIETIPALMSQVLSDMEVQREKGNLAKILLFYNRPALGAGFEPVVESLLPLDKSWLTSLQKNPWPNRKFPELGDSSEKILAALLREYIFVSLFKACARSGASEQATRLASMQRAEKNINDLLEELQREYHQKRQDAIMDELFDVISGFEVLSAKGQ